MKSLIGVSLETQEGTPLGPFWLITFLIEQNRASLVESWTFLYNNGNGNIGNFEIDVRNFT